MKCVHEQWAPSRLIQSVQKAVSQWRPVQMLRSTIIWEPIIGGLAWGHWREGTHTPIATTAFKLHHFITIRASHPIDFTAAAAADESAVKGANGAELTLDSHHSGEQCPPITACECVLAQCQPVLNDKGTY